MSPQGILSDSDKEYLASLDPENESAWDGDKTQKRFRIRQKIQAAIDDFVAISNLPRKEYELIFKELDKRRVESIVSVSTGESNESVTTEWEADQYTGLLHMLIFIYKACRLEPNVEFERLVEEAISLGEHERDEQTSLGPGGRYVNEVDVDIDISYQTQPDIEEIKAKLEQGGTLTRAEIGELYIKGELVGDEGTKITPEHLDGSIVLGESHPNGFSGLGDPQESVSFSPKQVGPNEYEWVPNHRQVEKSEKESEDANDSDKS
jgi:hypothetical protein